MRSERGASARTGLAFFSSFSLSFALVFSLVSLASLVAFPLAVHAGERGPALDHMRAIQALGGDGLESRINGGRHQAVEAGEPIVLHFESARSGYLTALYLDSDGNMLMVLPGPGAESSRIEAGKSLVFPPDADTELKASPPFGYETLFAVRTEKPVLLSELIPGGSDGLVTLAPDDARALLARLRALLEKRAREASEEIAVAHYEHSVVDIGTRGTHRFRGEQELVESLDPPVTRSIRMPRVDLDVRFRFDSDELTDAARAQLDEAGRALRNPRLRTRSFRVGGHTDAQGDMQYNKSLSERRARRVVTYLVEKFDIPEKQLEPVGYGESRPFVADEGPGADALNRRVELEVTNRN